MAGAAIFVLIYGTLPLDVTYDSWIFNNYIETDIVQRYAGWIAYRNSSTVLPFTFSDVIAWPFGDYTSLTDGMPLIILIFKLLNPILPSVFQFCGIVCLFNMMMQAVCGAKLISLFTQDKLQQFIGSMIFCFSPVLIERFFRHTSLSFHWLILLAAYLYFSGLKNKRISVAINLSVLAVMSVWIHLYFTPMIIGFFTAYIADSFLQRKLKFSDIALYIASFAFCFLSAKALGILDMGMGNTSGYGYMGMNLNALFNPVSLDSDWWVPGKGKLDWSVFLPMRALAENNIESFNYLGFGVLLSLAVFVVRFITAFFRKRTALPQVIKGFISMHLFLCLFLIFSTVFAVSNVVCAFSYVLVRIPLPDIVVQICSAFRASGRLFWSVNYMLVLLAIVHLVSLKEDKKYIATIAMAAVLIVQVADLSGIIAVKRAGFATEHVYYNQTVADQIVQVAGENDVAYFLEFKDDRSLCGQLLKNGISNNLWLINRDNYGVDKQTALIEQTRATLLSGDIPFENCIFLTTDYQLAQKIVQSCAGLYLTEAGGHYCLIPLQSSGDRYYEE